MKNGYGNHLGFQNKSKNIPYQNFLWVNITCKYKKSRKQTLVAKGVTVELSHLNPSFIYSIQCLKIPWSNSPTSAALINVVLEKPLEFMTILYCVIFPFCSCTGAFYNRNHNMLDHNFYPKIMYFNVYKTKLFTSQYK